MVIGRQYFTRQAKTLLNLARSTSDPGIAAALLEKATELNSRVDETVATRECIPLVPDSEPEL
jgi:hypothetical protein